MSLAYIAHGVCNPAKDDASPWWLDPTTVCQMASPQPKGDLRDHTHVIHFILTHSFRLTLFTLVAPKTSAAKSALLLITSLPLQSLFLSCSFFSPRRSTHFDTEEVLAVEDNLEGTTLTFVNVYTLSPPPRPHAP